MNLDDLWRKGFLPDDLVRRMAGTEPGRLASALDEWLYAADVQLIPLTPSKEPIWARLVGPEKVTDRITNQQVDARRLLRECFHYLEACALREAAR